MGNLKCEVTVRLLARNNRIIEHITENTSTHVCAYVKCECMYVCKDNKFNSHYNLNEHIKYRFFIWSIVQLAF